MLKAIAAEAPLTLTVELVLAKWNTEAWLMTAHLPRKRVARAFLVKVLEIARADVAAIPLKGTTSTEIASKHAVRRQALEILEEYVPRFMARLPAGAI